jgi:nicotinamidase/pyrazinamidase
LSTRVLLHLTAGVTDGTTDAAIEELKTAGVELEGTVHVG